MPRHAKIASALPLPVSSAIRELGGNIATARRRRRETQAALATRVMVSLPTLRKMERGDPSVGIAVYFSALWALGLVSAIKGLAAPQDDAAGQLLDLAHLPQRIRHGRAD
jgi:transcriptional regulator with XRE-family HTH domain